MGPFFVFQFSPSSLPVLSQFICHLPPVLGFILIFLSHVTLNNLFFNLDEKIVMLCLWFPDRSGWCPFSFIRRTGYSKLNLDSSTLNSIPYVVKENGNLLAIFNNSFFIQNTNGFIDWGLPAPHSKQAQEGPTELLSVEWAGDISVWVKLLGMFGFIRGWGRVN